MTDTPDAPAEPPPSRARNSALNFAIWCEAWRTCFQNVLTQVSGNVPASFEILQPDPAAADSDRLVHGCRRRRRPRRDDLASVCRLRHPSRPEVPRRSGACRRSLLPKPAPAEAITAENKEALEEFLRQIAGLAATALAATAGGEVKLPLSATAAPSWSSDAIVCLQTATKPQPVPSIAIEIRISPALAAALPPRVQPAPPCRQRRRHRLRLLHPSGRAATPLQLPPPHGCRPRRQTSLRNPPHAAARRARAQRWSRR